MISKGLTLNTGSSSVKYELLAERVPVVAGSVDRIGRDVTDHTDQCECASWGSVPLWASSPSDAPS